MTGYAIAGLILLGLALLMFVLFVFAVKPGRRRDASAFAGKFFAHRGLHDGTAAAPENSMAAFARAKEAGYGVEFDVQFTLDRQVVVFHDETLKRICGVDKKVRELTYEQLQEYTLLGGSEKIPTLAQVLNFLEDVPVVCEIKYYGSLSNAELCAAVVDHLEAYKGDACVESFSPFIIRWFRKNDPDRIRGQLASNLEFENLPMIIHIAVGQLLVNLLSRPDFVAYHYANRTVGLRLCRKLFKPLMVGWTYRDNDAIRDSADEGYHSFIFEDCQPEEELIIQ
jgi:glycerophosphoryl diester phosphodiesterase